MAEVTVKRIPEVTGFTGLPLDVTTSEIEVVNIEGLVNYPYLDTTNGYVEGASPTAIWDRKAREPLSNAGGINMSVATLAEGTPGLGIGSQNTMYRSPGGVDFSDGFTFFVVVNNKLGVSSNTSSATTGYWVYGDSTVDSGAITMRIGSYRSTAGDYSGPALNTSEDRLVCFQYDPTGTLRVRVDGVEELTYSDPSIASINPHPQYQFGLINDNLTGLTSAYYTHGGLLAYRSVLSTTDIETVESYLTSLKA